MTGAPTTQRLVTEPSAGFGDRLRRRLGQSWLSVGRSAGARMLVLPVSALLGIVVTRLVIGHYGEAAYGQYGLLIGIANLLPFADLGLSAAIMNAVAAADRPGTDERVRRTLVTAFRLLTGSALVIIIAAMVITGLGGWRVLLGEQLTPQSGPLAACLCLGLIGAAIPFGVGQRILTGLGRNHLMIITMGLQTPLVLLCVIIFIATDAPLGGYVAVAAFGSALVLAMITTLIAAQRIRPVLGIALRQAVRVRTVHGGKVFDLAWPMLIQMIALPVAMQSDRLVLSHLSGLPELTSYNLATQLYTPIWMVVSAAGMALWPIFARDRESGDRSGTSPHRMAIFFAIMAATMAALITAVSGPISDLASGGAIRLGMPLMISFSLLMIMQAAKYPLGMYLTDATGLRFQAYLILVMLPVNLGLSVWLAGLLGATGPVIGSVVGVLLCQVVPNWIYVSRRQRSADTPGDGSPAAAGSH